MNDPKYRAGYNEGFETGLRMTSVAIVLAQVVSKTTTDKFEVDGKALGPDGRDYADAPVTTLKVIRWVQGTGAVNGVTLEYVAMTSNGPTGPVSAVDGKVGERFILVSRDGSWASDKVISISAAQAASGWSKDLLRAK